MAAYMKTDMPFYGVAKPERKLIETKMKEITTVDSQSFYEKAVQRLWNLPHREEKYLGISFARMHKDYIHYDSINLYESMIRQEYAWWDLVDEIAIHLVGQVTMNDPVRMDNKLRDWMRDENRWIRRTAILAQLKHKNETNKQLLFDVCEMCLLEQDFFIQKAIGWALREYSKTNPTSVVEFFLKRSSLA